MLEVMPFEESGHMADESEVKAQRMPHERSTDEVVAHNVTHKLFRAWCRAWHVLQAHREGP